MRPMPPRILFIKLQRSGQNLGRLVGVARVYNRAGEASPWAGKSSWRTVSRQMTTRFSFEPSGARSGAFRTCSRAE